MKKHIDYDETEELDLNAGLESEEEDDGPVVPDCHWSVRAMEAAVAEDLIEYSSRPPATEVKTFVMSGPLTPYKREDVAIRLVSDKAFSSVAAARAYHLGKFGAVYEDQSRPDLGYWAFCLPVLG